MTPAWLSHVDQAIGSVSHAAFINKYKKRGEVSNELHTQLCKEVEQHEQILLPSVELHGWSN